MRRAIAALCVLLSGSPAIAQDRSRAKAKAAFERAEKLYRTGEFEAALESYREAYQELPAPAFLFNIGQCHRNLGQLEQAIFSFEQYLKDAPKAGDRERVKLLIRDLNAELEKQRENSRTEPQEDEAKTATIAPAPAPPVLSARPPVPPQQIASAPMIERDEPSPIYGRWWFWTLIGAAAVTAGAVAIASSGPKDPAPGSLHTFDFR